MDNPYERWIGGAAAHIQTYAGELGPAAAAQRKEFKRAKNRMQTQDYGFSAGQRNQGLAPGQAQIAGQSAQQESDIARQAAAGQLAGGAATEAQRAVAQQAQAGQAQNAANVQQASDAWAQGQYTRDQATIDKQAGIYRDMHRKQAQISQESTRGGPLPSGGGTPKPDTTEEDDAAFNARSKATGQTTSVPTNAANTSNTWNP